MTTLRPPVLEGFELDFIDTGEATIRVRHGGVTRRSSFCTGIHRRTRCGTGSRHGWPKTSLRGRALDCGHFLAEEAPDEVYEELRVFFAGG